MMKSRENTKVLRNSNIECLRIIAMLMIIASHFSIHGGFSFDTTFISVNRFYYQFLQIGGKIGVNLFILISGYFLVNSKQFDWKKVALLWGEIIFYSVVIYFFFVLIGVETFSIGKLIIACMPVISEEWWFASTYIILFLLYPFLNVLLTNLTKKQFQAMLLTMGVCWCIIPSSFVLNFYITQNELSCSTLLWFIFIYSMGGVYSASL